MEHKSHFRILAVDDDPVVLEMIYALLGQGGREVSLARSCADVEAYYEEPPPDVVLLDWRLPDGDSLEMLPALRSRWPLAQIVLMSGYATTETIVQAIKLGAYHFKTKPFSGEDLIQLVDSAFAFKQQHHAAETARPGSVAGVREGLLWPVAQSPGMKDVLRLTARVAPNEVCLLITGESGTGKEVIANLVHGLSLRAKGPMVSVNCATLPHELIESELFGVVKGAYTGATANRNGLIREAAGGTLFLDEIAEMPFTMQAKLLRVLQQREFRPVGGQSNLKAECRFIAATNRDPARAIAEGQFRSDLFYRIATITIHLPPLRERSEDLLTLANLFVERFAAQEGRAMQGLTPAAAEAIRRFSWPGNVRQLENELQRAVLMSDHARIDVADLHLSGPAPPESPAPLNPSDAPSASPLEDAEKAVILAELQAAGGSKRAVAKKLGIARQTLYNKLRHYGILDAETRGAKPAARVKTKG